MGSSQSEALFWGSSEKPIVPNEISFLLCFPFCRKHIPHTSAAMLVSSANVSLALHLLFLNHEMLLGKVIII